MRIPFATRCCVVALLGIAFSKGSSVQALPVSRAASRTSTPANRNLDQLYQRGNCLGCNKNSKVHPEPEHPVHRPMLRGVDVPSHLKWLLPKEMRGKPSTSKPAKGKSSEPDHLKAGPSGTKPARTTTNGASFSGTSKSIEMTSKKKATPAPTILTPSNRPLKIGQTPTPQPKAAHSDKGKGKAPVVVEGKGKGPARPPSSSSSSTSSSAHGSPHHH